MSAYRVELLSERETEQLLKSFKSGPTYLGKPIPESHKRIATPEGFELKGHFSLAAKDPSGVVEWEHEQDNLITDRWRQIWGINSSYGVGIIGIGFMPSTETPSSQRHSVSTDGNQCVMSNNLGAGSVTPATYTKTWSTTYGTPASNRTLGAVVIGVPWGYGTPIDVNGGMMDIWSWALLTPPKVQTTVQTLEVVYKISMNPIW